MALIKYGEMKQVHSVIIILIFPLMAKIEMEMLTRVMISNEYLKRDL